MFFTTARLTLRPVLPEDTSWLPALRDAPSVLDLSQFDSRLPPSVVLDSMGECIGLVLIWPSAPSLWRIEFLLLDSARGQGYAQEMVRAWGHRFQQLCPGDNLEAHLQEGDEAALKVLRFAGFEPCGAGRYCLEGGL